MRHATRVASLSAAAMALAGATLPAHAGWFDNLLGIGSAKSESPKASPTQRLWVVREFSEIRIVPREAGSQPNQHPATLNAEQLRQQLGQLRFADGTGSRPLFSPDECGELAEPLAEALGVASAGDDVTLVSSARRPDAVMFRPVAVTARVFVQNGALQFIVNDARFEFYENYRGTNQKPEFSFGSRARTGKAVLRDDAATVVRADWVAIPLAAAAVAPAPMAAPGAVAPAAAAAPAAPALRPRDPGFSEEIEQRLITVKRLRDKGLITEEEYQQKRAEILKSL